MSHEIGGSLSGNQIQWHQMEFWPSHPMLLGNGLWQNVGNNIQKKCEKSWNDNWNIGKQHYTSIRAHTSALFVARSCPKCLGECCNVAFGHEKEGAARSGAVEWHANALYPEAHLQKGTDLHGIDLCQPLLHCNVGDRASDQDALIRRKRAAARGNATTCPLAWEDMMFVHLFIKRHYECQAPGANSKMWGDPMIF